MKLAVNTHLNPDLAYLGHKGNRWWGEPVPYLDVIPDAKGKPTQVVLEGEWWTQKRMRVLLYWLDDARIHLRNHLIRERVAATKSPEKGEPLRAHIVSILEAARPRRKDLQKALKADPKLWRTEEIISGACKGQRLLLWLAEQGVVPHPQELVPVGVQMRERTMVPV